MDVSRQDLAERFHSLSDEALLTRVRAGTLTPMALEVALSELKSRGIEHAQDSTEAAQDDESFTDADDVDLVTVAQFSNPLEASVLRGCLETHGIFAFVCGEHLATANVILSTASGGLRVQVRSDQVEEAREVIAAFQRGELAVDEEPE